MAQAEPGPAPAPGSETAGTVEPEHKSFPPFDATHFASQLFWLAVTFLFFYWLITKVVVPRISGILAARRERISADIAEAERAKEATEKAAAAYEKQLADARAGAFRIAEEARGQAKTEADATRARIEGDLNRKLAEAEARIGDIKSKALADVGAIAGEAAEAVVKSLADVNVSTQEVGDAVHAALNERR